MSKPDRREKKKKEREEKRKAYRQRKQRLIRREKVEESGWLAEEAFARKEYRDALDWVLKGLGIPPLHPPLMNLALSSAQILGDDPTLYNLLASAGRKIFSGEATLIGCWEDLLTSRMIWSLQGRFFRNCWKPPGLRNGAYPRLKGR